MFKTQRPGLQLGPLPLRFGHLSSRARQAHRLLLPRLFDDALSPSGSASPSTLFPHRRGRHADDFYSDILLTTARPTS